MIDFFLSEDPKPSKFRSIRIICLEITKNVLEHYSTKKQKNKKRTNKTKNKKQILPLKTKGFPPPTKKTTNKKTSAECGPVTPF